MLKTLVLLVVCMLITPSASAKERTWNNSRGGSFVGDFLSQNDSEVTIRRASDKKEFSVPIQQLTQEDQDFLKQQPKGINAPSEETSYWAGKWENENSKFIFKIEKVANEDNQYLLLHQWVDLNGEVDEQELHDRYTGEFYHIMCYNIRLKEDLGVVAARLDGNTSSDFSVANLVRIPSNHEPLLELNLSKYGWKPVTEKFDEQDYRVPLGLMNGGTSSYQQREEKNRNIFKNGHFTEGNSSWKGELKLNPDAPKSKNLIAEFDVVGIAKMFSQTLETQGRQTIDMSFMYRCSLDYDGEGFEVRCVNDDGTYQSSYQRKMKAKWTLVRKEFKNLAGSKSPKIEIRIPKGTRGKIMFDEFSAELYR